MSPTPAHSELPELIANMYYIAIFVFLGLYFIIESSFIKYRPRFGHTSGVIVLLGVLASYVVWGEVQKANQREDENYLIEDLKFDPDVFFHLILPLIIFPSGYNMRRKKFFRNISTILKLGFVGTILSFSCYTAMIYFADQHGFLVKWDAKTQQYIPLNIRLFEILSICAILCSSDVISTISQVNFDE